MNIKNKKLNSNKLINNLIFYFYFYIFKYLKLINYKFFNITILKNLNIFDNFKYLNVIYYKNNYILLNNNYFKLIKYKIKHNNIIIDILYKNEIYNKFLYNIFFEYNLKIFFITEFFLQIDYLFFICYKDYINYFRLFKYNEYLFNHFILNKYKLLKNFIKILLKFNFYRENYNLNIEFGILNKIYIYCLNFKKSILNNFYLNYKYNNNNIYLNYKFKKINNIFFFKFIKNYLNNFLLLLLYKVKILYFEVYDLIEIKFFIYNSIYNLYNQLPIYKYNYIY
jgi:hypothetical protein